MCDAKIIYNGLEFECHCDDGHQNAHVTRVIMDHIVIDGFEWDIDDGGAVIVNMSINVAQRLFEISEGLQPGWDIPTDAPPDVPF